MRLRNWKRVLALKRWVESRSFGQHRRESSFIEVSMYAAADVVGGVLPPCRCDQSLLRGVSNSSGYKDVCNEETEITDRHSA